MPPATPVDGSFSPLDEELRLVPGMLTPALMEQVVYAASLTSFEHARALVERLCRVSVSEASMRRRTYAAGKAAVDLEAAFVRMLERDYPKPTAPTPARQQVSADGAMVKIVGGMWKEVRTLAIGTVLPGRDGPLICEQTYFSRLCDHDTFIRAARGEFYRRATENVADVEAVMDGAEWLTSLTEEHCPQALRILDFTHAAGALVAVAHAAFGQGTEACAAWVGPQIRELRHGEPSRVLAAILALLPTVTSPTAVAVILTHHAYLARREDQIRYAAFAAEGYSIGSGVVESANRHLVQERLKGAGMQWNPDHIDPLLALACARRNDRWDDTWDALQERLRRPRRHRPKPVPTKQPLPPPDADPPLPRPAPPPAFENGKPTLNHPWKRELAVHAKS